MNFNQIKDILENSNFQPKKEVYSSTNDGRLESAEIESEVIIRLKELFQGTDVIITEAPKVRFWYDVKIETDGKFYPVNIKITQGTSPDNIGSKEGLFFALTGLDPEAYKGIKNNWETYNTQLLDNLKENEEDYYFIVVFKKTGKILFTSLKRINKLVSNGNNLPFQCKWNDNLDYTTRTKKEQEDYLLNVFLDSFIKKSKGLDILLKWRNSNV